MISFDPTKFRSEFPALNADEIYLDSAATALKPFPVIDATNDYYCSNSATVHRGHYGSAQQATQLYEQARERVAKLIHSSAPQNIVWTKGATESINLIAQSYFRSRLKPNDEIIVCASEHHSNIIPWLMLAKQTGAKVIKLPLNSFYLPDITRLPEYLNHKTKVLVIGQMSNVTGGCPDLQKAISYVRANNTLIVVDGAQGIVHHSVNVEKLDIDFYAISSHKLYGPTGVGVLYAKSELLAEMSPWLGGGKMVRNVTFDMFETQDPPYRFEAGTPNTAGIIGFNAALAWLESLDHQKAELYSCQLAQYAEELLSTLPGFISYRCEQSSLLSFNFAKHHHSDIAMLLAEQGISLRHGQHCAQPLMAEMGVDGTLRASFAPYNKKSDADNLYIAIKKALELLDE